MAPDPRSPSALEIAALAPERVENLERFLHALREAGDDAHFHPHPADREYLDALARDSGQDLHYVVMHDDGAVVAYGMLRGWSDYAVPSLGIAVDPRSRGAGVGRMLMEHLHDEARRHGAAQVRLKVYPDNLPARRLYERLGYEFEGEEDGQLVGLIRL
jgi:ribosomal protein S18 acetylase RimI-like enzyme